MTAWFAPEALLPGGWARDVMIDVDAGGDITSVRTCSRREGAQALAGPVLPGMANLHSHAFQRAMASLAEVQGASDDDFWTWRELMYRFVDRISPEQSRVVARQLYIEMLKQGYTAVAEFHYVHNDPVGAPYVGCAEMLLAHLQAARQTGIAIALLPSLYCWGNFGKQALAPRQKRFDTDPATVLEMVRAARHAAGTDAEVSVGVAPHSLRAVDEIALRELIVGLHGIDNQARVHIHAAEQENEVADCLEATGQRPVAWLLENFSPDARWCLVHCTHMLEVETVALAASGAVVGLCPSTEGNLGDGIFPMQAYRAAGGRWGIGGDSHVSRDPAEELRLLEYVQRLATRRRNLVVTPLSPAVGTTLWQEAAAGGAQALGRAMGEIAPGRRADLVVLDADHVDLAARSGDAVANAFVFAGGDSMVRDVMVAGRWVVRDRHHAVEETAAREWKKVVAELLA